ncbi:MAG: FAD-dependent oxidoreductase [Tannerella sp.]|jgi:hypothetical protein|nr:FAD-dependent oxidoreductase [Tannerella sp.]
MQRRSVIKTLGGLSLTGILPLGLSSCSKTNNDDHLPVFETEILVVGGGTAGVIAAIQAGRAGCKTTLLENGSQLGGTITTGGVSFPGLFHAWGKQIISGIGWELVSESVAMNGDVLPDFTIPFGKKHPKHQVLINIPLYTLLAEEKCLHAGVNIRYYETPVKILRRNDLWEVEVVGKGTHCRIVCNQLIDCTGNALVTSMAGFRTLRETETQPGSLIFELDGYDLNKLDSKEMEERHQEALQKGVLLKTDVLGDILRTLNARGGGVPQHVLNADSTTSVSHSLTNIEGRASMLRILRFVKTLSGCEKTYIAKMQPETAVRETYRIDGVYQITRDDYVTGKIFEDALSYSYYPIDLHVEGGVTPKHLTEGTVATIPLRALIPKNSENLIVAGRCVSSDRLANSALRVQASCMGMGQVAGATAALALKKKTTPASVPVNEIKQLLAKHDGIVPV